MRSCVDYETEVITDKEFKQLRFKLTDSEFGTRWYSRWNRMHEIIYHPIDGATEIWDNSTTPELLWQGTVENFQQMQKKVKEYC